MKRYSESKIQSDCYRWFTNNYGLIGKNPRCVMFSVPNEIGMMIRGALKNTRLSKATTDQIVSILSQRMKNMGLRSGVSDTVIQLPGKTIYVEFKTPTGVQSDSQKDFQKITESLENEYYIVRSLEQFQQIIDHNLKNLII